MLDKEYPTYLTEEFLGDLTEKYNDVENMVAHLEEIAAGHLPLWLNIWNYPVENIRDFHIFVDDFAELVKDGMIRVHYRRNRGQEFKLLMPVDFLLSGGIKREVERASKMHSEIVHDFSTIQNLIQAIYEVYPTELVNLVAKCVMPKPPEAAKPPETIEELTMEIANSQVDIPEELREAADKAVDELIMGIEEEVLEDDVVQLEPSAEAQGFEVKQDEVS